MSCEAEAEGTWIVWSGWGWEATLLLPAASEEGEAKGGTGLCVWELMEGWEPHRAATEEVKTRQREEFLCLVAGQTRGEVSQRSGWCPTPVIVHLNNALSNML